MPDDRIRPRRLFFALWPDERVRKALAWLMRSLPRRRGTPVPVANLHITLTFAGAVKADVYDCLRSRAAGIEVESFLLRLTRIGYFRRSCTLWLGADTRPTALTFLVEQLHSVLENCGPRPDFRSYWPHVTLYRAAGAVPNGIVVEPIDWPVDCFCLIESHTGQGGARYEVLQRFSA